jgi:signal transduction histidine kinase
MLILLAIVAVTGVVTYVAFSRSLSDEIDDSLRSSAQAVASQIEGRDLDSISSAAPLDVTSATPDPAADSSDGGDGEGADDDSGEDEGEDNSGRGGGDEDEDEDEDHEDDEVSYFTIAGSDTFYLVLAPDGTALVNPENVQAEGVPDLEAAQHALADGDAWSTASAGDTEVRLYSLAVRDQSDAAAVVQVGRALAERDRQLATLLIVLIVSGSIGLACAAIGGLLIAGRALRPIRTSFERQRAFVSDASHELRTPLTIIRGNAEMLGMRDIASLSEEDRQGLEDIIGQSQYLEQLVVDLSLLARSDEGQLPLRRESVAVDRLLEDMKRSAAQLGAEKQLKVHAMSPAGMTVHADPVRLKELLLALVENAVAHTPAGGSVTLDARNGTTVAISVADTGPGIDPAQLERVFDRFYRVDEARSRNGGGTGLGLSIAYAIAHAHGGSLTAENVPGAGARLTVTLPAK